MGTRSLTVIVEADGKEICVLYRQFDGYLIGHGLELKQFLDGFSVVNGLRAGNRQNTANGMSCLAALIVANFKSGPGGFYLYPPGTRDCGEEYIYTVYPQRPVSASHSGIYLKVQAGCVTFFGFPGTKQENMPVLYDGPVESFDPEAVHESWRCRDHDPVNDFLDSQILSSEIIGTD